MQAADHREVLGKLLSTQQQLIDLRAQLDREHLVGEGFRRFGERAFEVDKLEDFFAIATEEVVATFGAENALLVRFGRDGPAVCSTCCADDAALAEVCAIAEFVKARMDGRAQVLNDGELPSLRGRPSAVLFLGTYVDASDADGTYAMVATVSKQKAPFYPAFGPELAPLYEAFLHHVGALQQHLRGRAAAVNLMRATQHFVPQEFLQALGHADVTTARLGDAVLRRATILFADIRNFTAISERMTPAETAAFLNTCLSRMGPQIRAHGGFVDKYIGDAIMALFPASPTDAVQAALAMQREMAGLEVTVGQRRSSGSYPNFKHTQPIVLASTTQPVVVGIGIHVGEVMMCTVGEQERFEATVISDAVNLTARLETLTKQLGCTVLVSGAVADVLDPETAAFTRELGLFAVKGKSQSVRICEVFVNDGTALRDHKRATREAFAQALQQYGEGQVEDALATLRPLAAERTDDGPLAWWLAHLRQELAHGGPRLSRGVVRLDQK